MEGSPGKLILIAARFNDSPTLKTASYLSFVDFAIAAPFLWLAGKTDARITHNQNIAYFAKFSNFLFSLFSCALQKT